MARNKKTKIAIVVDGKDICRIIPFKSEFGKYDLKIDFLEKDFEITLFTLFCEEPKKFTLDDLNQRQITYHKGTNEQPIVIHLKHKDVGSYNKYVPLPIDKIVAPNVNSRFPLPLMKIEVPKNVQRTDYVQKSNHRVVDVEHCNVLEIFMVHSDFDFDTTINKLPDESLLFLTLSFESYATNSMKTGLQKYANFFPKDDEPKTVLSAIELFNEIQILIIHYYDPNLDGNLSKINATFIENKFSDAILKMTVVKKHIKL